MMRVFSAHTKFPEARVSMYFFITLVIPLAECLRVSVKNDAKNFIFKRFVNLH